jgi:Ser/Thr protein kinase RdoA (MazF antagonist)
MNGLTSLTYFLHAEGHAPMVLHREDSVSVARSRLNGHRLLTRYGVPVPAILYSDLRRSTQRQWGGYFLLEERLPGYPLEERDDAGAIADSMAHVFAQLHSNQGLRWWSGSVCSKRVKAIFSFQTPLERKLRLGVSRLLAEYQRRNLPHIGEIRRALDLHSRVWRPTPRLCHGDPSDTNLIVCANSVRLIDFDGAGFGWAAHDLARLRSNACFDNIEAWNHFLSVYCMIIDEGLRREIDEGLHAARVSWLLHNLIHEPSESTEENLALLFDVVRAADTSPRRQAA